MATPFVPANPPIGPLGLIGDVAVPNIETRTEEQYFQDVTTPTGLKPIQPGAATPSPDPFAGFADAPANFDQFQDAPDAFAGFKSADDLDIKSVDELNKDREGFNPVSYFASNPDAANDPAKLSKLLAIYRKRRDEGLDAGEVVKSALKETPGLVANIAGGVKRLGERAIDVTVQPIANVVLGTLTGDLFDEQKRNALFNETRRVIKKGVAEVGAGSEAATVGLVDLTRTGIRKLDPASLQPGNRLPPGRFNPPTGHAQTLKPKTDQELLRDLSDDVAFRQNAAEILAGQGEAAKNFGLDKESLAKQGIELDEKAIEQLSLVDPITMVATGGAFKLVGIGGKVLGTAKTLAGVQYASGKLADLAKYSAGKTIQAAGTTAAFVGKKLQGSGRTAALITGLGAATQGAGTVEALAIAGVTKALGPVVRDVGKKVAHAGKAIAGEVPITATTQKIIDYAKIPGRAAETVGKGAFTGIAAAAPFAVMADEDATAGALFGAGAALGVGAGAGAGAFRVVKRSASRRYFGENRPVLEDVPSPAYGKDAALDATHEANVTKLSAQDSSELNNFREVFRQQGGEVYSMDRPAWRVKLEQVFPDATPEQLDIYENHSAFFDESQGDRKIVYLNTDTTGLQHDAGHIFDAILAPAKRAELRKAVTDAFPEKAIQDFQATYERRVGNKISKEAALDEFIAEQFAALFNNVPVTELAAPRSLLTKFVDTLAEGAEALGIDLTAGATTPSLGAPVSVGIRKLFLNAAGDVVRANIEGVPPTNVTPFPGGGSPPPSGGGPVTPPPTSPITPPTNVVPLAPAGPVTPPPANVVPLPGSRNIRVGPADVAAFKQQASPGVRALADADSKATGVEYARAEAKKNEGSPTSQIIERISDSMESGAPVVGIEHLGITSESTPAAPAGRTVRRGEQAAGYAALEAAQLDVRQNAPPEIVAQHSKNFVPVRWTNQGGTPTLIAMSLDKVISNMMRIAADPKAKDLIPYAVENGKFTPESWREVVADAQAYSENQANGRKGDGGRLEVPEAGLSIPAENPTYTPKPLSPERANFQNLVQGLAPPRTSRETVGEIPGNVKGQLLAEANFRTAELPANIPAKQASKQAFVGFPPRVIQEVNPLRNTLERAGVKTRELLEVTERIRAKDIVSATPKPEINYKAPVTDIIRGGFLPKEVETKVTPEDIRNYWNFREDEGRVQRMLDAMTDEEYAQFQQDEKVNKVHSPGHFLPAPTEFRQKNLGGRTVEEFSDYILKATPEEWKAATDNMTGGLTGGAWNLGLGLKDAGDVGVLKSYADKFSDSAKAAMKAGDFDLAFSNVTRGQFFREAYEAATGTGSAGAAFKRGTAGMESAIPPFPIESTTTGTASAAGSGTTEAAKFLPSRERALTAPEQIDLAFDLENRYGLTENGAAFVVRKLMEKLGQTKLDETVEGRGAAFQYFHGPEGDSRTKSILSVLDKEGTKPSDLRTLLDEETPQATAEQLKGSPEHLTFGQVREIYRKLPSKLQGKIVPLRNFGEDGAVLSLYYDQNNPATTVARAQKYLNPLGFDVVSDSLRGYFRIEKIGPKGPNKFDFGMTRGPNPFLGDNEFGLDYGGFLPAEQIDFGTVEQPPELRVLRTPAAAGGTPPIEPPSGVVIPPPVAAGFQPAEELQPEETPVVRVLPAATGGRVPPIGPTFRPPPVAAGVARKDEEAPRFLPAPDKKIQDLAKSYADDAGIPYAPKGGYAEVKPELAKRIAKFYDKAKSDPTNPEVVASYEALIRETEEQGKAILAAGYKIEPWTGGGEPYRNSAAAIADVRDNKHLFFRQTSDAFGSGNEAAGNPMLRESTLVPGQSVNDVFRWVHDFFGHSKEGFQFGPRGEFNAWRAHSEMYSPEAQGALAGETLAQNSWVNYGPHLEGKNIPLAERPFAEQKNVVVPKELIDEATFLPRTESGRKLEERGYEIIPSGEMGMRRVAIRNLEGEEIASIQSVQRSPKNAEIVMVQKIKGAPKGLGEVLYREVGAQLKDDGVTKITGQVVSPEPIAIRKKVFGDFASIDINGEPATFEQAIAIADQPRYGNENELAAIEPVSRITAETRFLPKGKRDAQGRPLNKDGEIDYAKWQKEGLAARKKQQAEPIVAAKQTGPVTEESGNATGWILPDKKFVPLDAAFHEQYLANNSEGLNKKFGTEFSDVSSPDDRLLALNAGFVRLRNQNGQLRVEVNARKFPSVKSKLLNILQDREGQIDGLTMSLLNDQGVEVDSTSAARLHELSGPEKFDAISEAVDSLRTGRFQPGEESLPGFEDISVEQAGRLKAKRRIAAVKKNNPEAVTPQYARDEAGEIIVAADGNPKPLTLDYDFINSPVAKEAAKGLKGVAREEAAAKAIGNKLVDFYRDVEKNPEIKAGSKWYSTARTRLKKVFGDDSKFFAELLGATSARTPVEINYRFALDAYNQFKAGAYDKTLAKYREGKAAWDAQDLGDFKGETRGQFMDFWVRKHDLGVTQSSGAKFGMNSRAVLRVLDGSWASEVQGPKTPNFAGNLTGESFRATIDVWSGRTLNRLATEGKTRWRILPENEVGINDSDFYLGQAAYASAAKKLGIRADSLQAVLWFAEKDKWEKNGWTRGAGAAKSDFNVLLGETERTPSGKLQMKSPQTELGLDTSAELGNIVKKKR